MSILQVTVPDFDILHVTVPDCDILHVTVPDFDILHVTVPYNDILQVTVPDCYTLHKYNSYVLFCHGHIYVLIQSSWLLVFNYISDYLCNRVFVCMYSCGMPIQMSRTFYKHTIWPNHSLFAYACF